MHYEKMYKLKILLESLANSTSKAEKRISDHRSQKEEALSFRVAKSNEVHQAEKELVAEINLLERQRDELEAELKRVNTSLAATRMRLHHTKEERDQFDEASNQILVHLKTKEDELLKSIASSRAEAEVVDTWIKFLEDTWILQTSHVEQKEKQFLTTMSIVETMKKQFYVPTEGIVSTVGVIAINPLRHKAKKWKDDQKIKELFDGIEKLRDEFESIERPTLGIETPDQKSVTPFNARNNQTPKHRNGDSLIKEIKKTTHETELELIELDSDIEAEEINDWEFNALEKD